MYFEISQKSTTCRLHGDFEAQNMHTSYGCPFNFFLGLKEYSSAFPFQGGVNMIKRTCFTQSQHPCRTRVQYDHCLRHSSTAAFQISSLWFSTLFRTSQDLFSLQPPQQSGLWYFLLPNVESVKLCTGILTTSWTNLPLSLKKKNKCVYSFSEA